MSQIQNDQERVVAYCSRALRPSQRRYCTTKREMLAAVAMCIQFRSYLRGARFTLRTDNKSLVWLHRFKDTEGMMSRWLHSLQQFQFSIIHRPGKDHGNADGLSRAPSSPCRQCTRPDCPPVTLIHHETDQPFDSVSTGSSEDADLVPVQSGEDWIARLDDDLSRPVETSGDSFHILTLQKEDPVCMTLHAWVVADEFPAWAEVKSMLPELRSLWHHRNKICPWTPTVHYGENEAHRAPSYSYWSQRLAENDFSCLIMHLCMEVIWDGRGRWRGWQIVSIGQGWRMT